MIFLLLTVLVLSFCGFVICVALRGPLIRMTEERHGLAGVRQAVDQMRAQRTEERQRAIELDARKRSLQTQVKNIVEEMKKLEDQVAKLPKQTFNITFELGTADAGMQAFDFVINRGRRPDNVAMAPAERDLWAKPRMLRSWARNQSAALSLATNRFPQADGFSVRLAEPGGDD